MGIEIKFVRKGGIHCVIDDGCEVNLRRYGDKLSFEQKEGLAQNNSRRNHLFYMNDVIAREYAKEGISLYCPTCGNNYEITLEMYVTAFEKFIEEEEP